MELDVGYVCGKCDAYAPLGDELCPSCSATLGFGNEAPERGVTTATVAASKTAGQPPSPKQTGGGFFDPLPQKQTADERGRPPAGAKEREPPRAPSLPSIDAVLESNLPSMAETPAARRETVSGVIGPVRIPVRFQVTEALMEQARNYTCKKCYSPVPHGHKFCGRCGEAVPREVLAAQTLLLSKMLEPGKAKLVVIKGEGFQTDPSDETAFLLGGRQHPCGRTQGDILFDRDAWVSPLHATFYYRDDGRLVVRDENSLNGVYIRIRGTAPLQPGDTFLSGEQVFRLEVATRASDGPGDDGTLFYSSPKRPSPFRVVQLLRGGLSATTVCARESAVAIGREGCDMNFPNDPYMSTRHCKVELAASGAYQLVDTGSKNGTYLSVRGERELGHGDYLFVGRELLRVDISA